jgi:hypothetical protein
VGDEDLVRGPVGEDLGIARDQGPQQDRGVGVHRPILSGDTVEP